MPTSLDALAIRRTLGRDEWRAPVRFGPDGWKFESMMLVSNGEMTVPCQSLICTVTDRRLDGHEWIHASIANATGDVPLYEDLQLLHRAVFRHRYAYQLFVPEDSHINIHPRALHLWGRLDGEPAMPDFGKILGTI